MSRVSSINNPATHNSSQGYYRIDHVLEIIPIGKTRWYAGIKSGEFPAPVKLGNRVSMWRKSEIHALVERLGA